jgi:hypothetical protein
MRMFPKIATGAWLVGVLVFSARDAPADQIGYAVESLSSELGNLYSVDLTKATATLIGPTVPVLDGLAISPDNTLFGTDLLGDLRSININTGASTLIGSTALGFVEGLDFNGATLLGTNLNPTTTVYQINTTTAAPTPITSYQGVTRAMAVLNPTTIYVVVQPPAPPNVLLEVLESVSLITGAATVLGQLPNIAFIGSLDFGTDGNLYALDVAGNDFVINQTNGSGTLIGNTGGQKWVTLTIPTAVSEPSSVSLLLIAALGLIGVRATALRREQEQA